MLGGGVGILRTLPPARSEDVDALRALAPALGVEWPAGSSPGTVIAGLDPARPEPRRLPRGGRRPAPRRGLHALRRRAARPAGHGGVGAPYAHVTAPLRRLVDRFGTEVCLALSAGAEPAPELRAALAELPALMAASDKRTHEVERAVIDATEAWVLRGREGEEFSAVVVDAQSTGAARSSSTIRRCAAGARARIYRPGTRVQVLLERADVAARTVRFVLDGAGDRRPRDALLSARLQGFGTTVFAEMSALAAATGSINLGQGFPDYPGPPEVLDAARAAIGTAADQYPPGPGIPDLRAAVAEHQQRFTGLATTPGTRC